MNRTLLVSMVAAATVGCVSQGTYDTLRAEHDATQKELEARNEAIREWEQKSAQKDKKIASLERQEQELRAAIADEQQRVADLTAEIRKLESDQAKMLKDKTSLEASVGEMQAALEELQKRKAAAEARIAEYKGLLAKFRSLIDAGKLKVKIVEGRMVVVLATDVLFGSGSASLSKDGKAAIAEVAQLLASIPKRTFQVEGHTDNVPISTAQYPSNWELAAARALTVVKTMVDAGMPADRISAASFGQNNPAASNETPEGRAANRRIEIIIVPDLSTLPGFEELQKVEKGDVATN